ncbi:MAG: class II fumarate hydratase [Planctomycetes bacterium]|nr:class II fumarate hydratase [Planctomycetota bacterium]MCP4837941.1 class II fumarate hydratase [Planctomycetota bacterium]
MATTRTRTDHDSMGELQVPIDAMYSASTQRAVQNFPISGRSVSWEIIHAFAMLKKAAAETNNELDKLDAKRTRMIVKACSTIAKALENPATRPDMMKNFPVDIFQTGSGTSTNVNFNEVVANIISVSAGKKLGSFAPVHPNDHVNMGQSSNDTFPTAVQIAAASHIKKVMVPDIKKLAAALHRKAKQFDTIVKIGRTHLQDATPIRLGQEFSGFASQMDFGVERGLKAVQSLAANLPIGGTAVGTGINTHPRFASLVAKRLSKEIGVRFREAANHFEAQASRDCVVEAHGDLRTIAISLSKIASDIRFMGSGPRCGIHELELPAIQPGSSIMPGKVNPVLVESVMQVAMKVSGNDVTIGIGGFGGAGSLMDLNVAQPMMSDCLLESIKIIGNVSRLFAEDCVKGIKANRKAIKQTVEQSLMLGTALAPVIGYDQASKIAKACYKSGQTIREYCLEHDILPAAELDKLLDVTSMTYPH